MRILLANLPWRKDGYFGIRAGSRWPHFESKDSGYLPFPFYLAYATSLLEQEGHEVLLVDAVAEDLTEEAFLARLERFAPDMIVIEGSFASHENDIQLARTIKKTWGGSIVLCGPHVMALKSDFLAEVQVIDYVIEGEYEGALLALVNVLGAGSGVSRIPGVTSYCDNTIVRGPARRLIDDLDFLPWPARDFTPLYCYEDGVCGLPAPSLQMWASRGCPFSCIFCAWPQQMYQPRNYRVRSVEDVVDEMTWAVKEFGFESVYFDDDTFNVGEERIIHLSRLKQQRLGKIPWAAMCRADTMTPAMLRAMVQSGLYSVKYGVESGVQKLLDNAHKRLKIDAIRKAVKMTRDMGVKMHLTFTFGLPGETKETISQTLEFMEELRPDTVQFSITTPFPGTTYYDYARKRGFLRSEDWGCFDGLHEAVVRTEHLSAEQLETALKEANCRWQRHVRQRKVKSVVKRFIPWKTRSQKEVADQSSGVIPGLTRDPEDLTGAAHDESYYKRHYGLTSRTPSKKADVGPVIFLTREGFHLPGGRIRCYYFAQELRKRGMEAFVLSFKDQLGAKDGQDEAKMPDIERIYRNAKALCIIARYPNAILYVQRMHYHALAAILGKQFWNMRLVFDMDDWDNEISFMPHVEKVFPFCNGQRFTEMLARKSDLCVASSRRIADYLGKHNKNVALIETGPDCNKFRPLEVKRSSTEVVFTWIGTLHRYDNIENVLFLVKIFAQLAKRYANIRLDIVGTGKFHHELKQEILPYSYANLRFIDWIDPEDIPAYMATTDVGLFPLLQDTLFNKCKSPTKLFEYMACGKATVSSSIGEATRVVEDGKTGFLAGSRYEFATKMEKLIIDPDLRSRMGQAARQHICKDFSMEILGDKLARALLLCHPGLDSGSSQE